MIKMLLTTNVLVFHLNCLHCCINQVQISELISDPLFQQSEQKRDGLSSGLAHEHAYLQQYAAQL